MIFTHLPHSAPTSAHRFSRKVRGLPALIPFVTTGSQNLRTSPVVMTAGSVRGQRTQLSVLGPKAQQGSLRLRANLRVEKGQLLGCRRRGGGQGGGKSVIYGARATFKSCCGTSGCRPICRCSPRRAAPTAGAGSAAAGADAVPGSEGGRRSLPWVSVPEAALTFEDCRPLPVPDPGGRICWWSPSPTTG